MNNIVGKNSIYSLIKSFSQVAFPLITFPYISRTLMAENVGKINFGNSIVSYISLIASLGITTYAVRECSKVRKNKEELEDTASQIISINIITTLIAYILLAVVLIIAKPLYQYRTLIIILSIIVAFITWGADWINTAMEDFKYITIRTFLFQLFSLVAMFCIVHKPEDYMKYAIITVISSSGGNIANIFYRKRYCKIRFTFKVDWKKHMPPIMLLFAMVLSQTIFVSSDITILGFIKGDIEVGLYSTSVKIYNLINSIIASIAWVVMPQMSYFFSIKNYKEINKLVKYSLNFIVVFGLPFVVGINVLCPEIIEIVAGKEYLRATTSLHILSVSLVVSLLSGLIGNIILLPSLQESVCLKACVSAAIVNIVANLIFIPIFGMDAAAVTTLISQFITLVIFLGHVDKNIKITNIGQVIFAPIIGSIGIIITILIVSSITTSLWVKAIAGTAISFVIYLIFLIILKNQFVLDLLNPVLFKLRRK